MRQLKKPYSDMLAREPLHLDHPELRSPTSNLLGRYRDDNVLQSLDPNVGDLKYRRAAQPTGARREAPVEEEVGLERRAVGVCTPRGARVLRHGMDVRAPPRVWGMLEGMYY